MYKGRDSISCVIMSCKELAAKEKSAIKQCVALLNKAPKLAVIVVGDNMASQSYSTSHKKILMRYKPLLDFVMAYRTLKKRKKTQITKLLAAYYSVEKKNG